MTKTTAVVLMRLASLLVCLVLAYCSWLVVHQGLADSIAEDARTEMLSWGEAEPDLISVHKAFDLMLRANKLDSMHPTYLHRLGRLSHLLMGLELSQRDEWAERAKGYFRESIVVRPLWPAVWASLALVKADLLEFDGEMELALNKATSLGPWEPGVILTITTISTVHTKLLSNEMQVLLASNIARGLRSPVKGVAADVDGMLDGIALNLETIEALEELLTTSDWSRNSDQLLRVALQYYDEWQSASMKVIRTRVVQEISMRPHTVRFLTEKRRLVQLCPYLPRKPMLQKACSRI